MCRYAFGNYKPHYACFKCRKTFKRWNLNDTNVPDDGNRDNEFVKCPQCAGQMYDMGLDFEAPKQRNKKAWQFIQNLHRTGITWHSCGCSGPGYIPKSTEEHLKMLNRAQSRYGKQHRYWVERQQAFLGLENPPKSKNERRTFDMKFSKAKGEYWLTPTHLQHLEKTDQVKMHQEAIDYWVAILQEIKQYIHQIKNEN